MTREEQTNSLIHRPRLVIAGPCSAESREQVIATAREIASLGRVDIFRAGVWKPRTSPKSFEGAGDVALDWLREARALTGMPIATEVATAQHVEKALAAGVDVLWIGARTTSNPFSVQEIADALGGCDTPVLVKNPITADVELWVGSVERLARAGVRNIGLIHRGFTGYGVATEMRNAPLWQVALEAKRELRTLPLICDPSHICGNRTHLLEVAQQAADLDYSGVMLECHTSPEDALSDARQQITPAQLGALLERLIWRSVATDSFECREELERLRGAIDRLDEEIFALIAKRMEVADEIGHLKLQNNMTILQSGRWEEVVERVTRKATQMGVSGECTHRILDAIHIESIERQEKIMK